MFPSHRWVAVVQRLLYSLLLQCNMPLIQNYCSISYLRSAHVSLCTKARSRVGTPAFLAINLCKSDSSNISPFLAEQRGTLANVHVISRSLSLSMTLVPWSFDKQRMPTTKKETNRHAEANWQDVLHGENKLVVRALGLGTHFTLILLVIDLWNIMCSAVRDN